MPSSMKASVSLTAEAPHALEFETKLPAADPLHGDLMRHLRACAGDLGQIVPDPAFFFVVFYPQMTGEHG